MRPELERIPIPGEPEARERAREVVARAFAEHEPRPVRRRGVVFAVAAAAAILLLALSPAGSAVVRSVREAVGVEQAEPALTRLPAPGRLLVTSAAGPWIVQADGSKRLLGPYAEASWSPFGLFVAVTRRHELLAVDPKGNVRWSLARGGPVTLPRWAPDGYRIAYLDGPALRIVNGDGTGDRGLALASQVAPAWRPSRAHEHVLAFVTAPGDLELVDVGGAVVARRALPPGTRRLLWSADGSRLVAVSPRVLTVLDREGRKVRTIRTSGPALAAALHGRDLAVAQRDETRVYDLDTGRSRQVFRGAIRDLAWSPDGRRLLLSWPDADQWLFVGGRGPVAVAAIRSQFDPQGGRARFPRIEGWCC